MVKLLGHRQPKAAATDKRNLTPPRHLSTLPVSCLLLYITTESRQPILHLALAMQQRARMQGLWDAAKTLDLPAKFTSLYSP